MKKRIVFLPLGNINMASSRVRCYQVAAELNKLGWNCEINGKHPKAANFVVFQKRFGLSDQFLAKRCRGTVIFDQSDPYWEKEYGRIPIGTMARIARIVTISTSAQAKWFKKRGIKAVVIPNGLDLSIAPKVGKENKFTICWTGQENSERYLPMLVPALKKLSQIVNFNLNYCYSAQLIDFDSIILSSMVSILSSIESNREFQLSLLKQQPWIQAAC